MSEIIGVSVLFFFFVAKIRKLTKNFNRVSGKQTGYPETADPAHPYFTVNMQSYILLYPNKRILSSIYMIHNQFHNQFM